MSKKKLFLIQIILLISTLSFHIAENSQDGFVEPSGKSSRVRVEQSPVKVPDIFPVGNRSTKNAIKADIQERAFHKRAVNAEETFTQTLVYPKPVAENDDQDSEIHRVPVKRLLNKDIETGTFQSQAVDLGDSEHTFVYPEIPLDESQEINKPLHDGPETGDPYPNSAKRTFDKAITEGMFHKRAIDLQDIGSTYVYTEPPFDETQNVHYLEEASDDAMSSGLFHEKAVDVGDSDRTYVFPEQSLEDESEEFPNMPSGSTTPFMDKPITVNEVVLLKPEPGTPPPVLMHDPPRKRRPRRGGVQSPGHFLEKEVKVHLPFVTDRFHNPVTGSFIRPHMYGSSKWKALLSVLGSHDNSTQSSVKDSFYNLLAEVIGSLRNNANYGTPLKTEIQNILELKRELMAVQQDVQEYPDYLTAEWNETLEGFRDGHHHTMKMLSNFVDAPEDGSGELDDEPILVLEGNDLEALEGFRKVDDEVSETIPEGALPTKAFHVYNFGIIKEIKHDKKTHKKHYPSSTNKSQENELPSNQLKVMQMIDELTGE